MTKSTSTVEQGRIQIRAPPLWYHSRRSLSRAEPPGKWPVACSSCLIPMLVDQVGMYTTKGSKDTTPTPDYSD